MPIERRNKYKSLAIGTQNDSKLDINFDITALDYMARYAVSMNGNLYRSQLIKMSNLFDMIKSEYYVKDPEKNKRYNFIKKALDARLNKNITERDLIFKYASGSFIDNETITSNMFPELTSDELEYISGEISTSLKYSFISNDIDEFEELCTKFKTSDFISKNDIINQLEDKISQIQNKFRKSKADDSSSEMMFSLKEGSFENSIRQYYQQLSNPSNKLLSGMQGLNELVNGGFESGRVYMFLGLPGDGKSVTLLNLAYQIKMYNKHYKCKDLTKIPCIVLLTMENTVRETLERLFTMATPYEAMTDLEIDDVITSLRNEGQLVLNDQSPIDIIIKYKQDHSVDTSYLYTLTEDLEDDGYEVICFIQDYIKRIRSTENIADIRLELGTIVNEFKSFATIKDIPVITASQLNRDAAAKVDDARKSNKNDLIRSLGRSNVGESMLMIENLDYGAIIASEYDSKGNKYMGIETIKKRFKVSREHIFQPFVQGTSIRLCEDLNEIVPLFKETLRENLRINTEGNIKYSVYNKDNNFIDLDEADLKNQENDKYSFSGTMLSSNDNFDTAKPNNIIYINDTGDIMESAPQETSTNQVKIVMPINSQIVIPTNTEYIDETQIYPIEYIPYDTSFEDNLWNNKNYAG